jgi:hypothetical protein
MIVAAHSNPFGRCSPCLSLDEVRDVIGQRVRVLSLEQIVRTAFSDARSPRSAARQAAKREVTRGKWSVHCGMARPEVVLASPLGVFDPEEQMPPIPAGRLSWQARRRWVQPPVATVYVTATPRSRAEYGLPAVRPITSSALTHDLHVGQIFLGLLATSPERARLWTHEDCLDQRDPARRPDAVINEARLTWIDFIGAYSSTKIAQMLNYCEAARVRCEFW